MNLKLSMCGPQVLAALTLSLLASGLLASGMPAYAQPAAPIFDSGSVSGLGARNIGSAVMSGRIAALAAHVVDGKTVATLSFSGAGTDFGSLQDGNWILTVAASGVSAGSVPMTANYSTPTSGPGSIHRLFGDINGDRTVEGGGDFSQFGAAFGSSVGNPLYLAAFDFNLDGTIEGGADFSEFGNRFGLSL